MGCRIFVPGAVAAQLHDLAASPLKNHQLARSVLNSPVGRRRNFRLSWLGKPHPFASGRLDHDAMIIRLSQRLKQKIKTATSRILPLDANPYADWSAHLFTAERAHYILITNTASLYSTVLHGRGATSDSQFLDRALSQIREFMVDDGQEFIYRRLIAPSTGTVHFSRALNRSVTGSMNDLVFHAKVWLAEGDLSPHDVSFKLNEIPMSALGYANPREMFKSLRPG
jgi:phosphoribosyl-ATP pyrophosphohydrolase